MNHNNAKVYNANIKTDDCGFRVKTDIAIEALPCSNTQSTPMSSSGNGNNMSYFKQTYSPHPAFQDTTYPGSSFQNLADFLVDLLFNNNSLPPDLQVELLNRFMSLCESVPAERRTESLENLLQVLEEINSQQPDESGEQEIGIAELFNSLLKESLPQEMFEPVLTVILDGSKAIPQNQRTQSLENLLQQLTQNPQTDVEIEWSETYTDFNPLGWSTKNQYDSTISEGDFFDENSGAERIEVLVASPVTQ